MSTRTRLARRAMRWLLRTKAAKVDLPPAAHHAEPFPQVLFDAGFYNREYPDVDESGLTAWQHFSMVGRWEGRIASEGMSEIASAVRVRAGVSDTPLGDIVGLFPPSAHPGLAGAELWLRIRRTIHPALYAAQLPPGHEWTVDSALAHFLAHGAFDGLRVSFFFNEDWYRYVRRERGMPELDKGIHPFFDWVTVGWDEQIVPTPVFDPDYYRANHPKLKDFKRWVFQHYVHDGCYRPNRPSHPALKRPRGRVQNAQERQHPLLLVDALSESPDPEQLRRTSPLEERAKKVNAAIATLQSPNMRDLVAKAAAIEPLIMRPRGVRGVNCLPYVHPRLHLLGRAEAARRSLQAPYYDTVVLIPHCRMAGSARVAGVLTHALGMLEPNRSVLLLVTDRSSFERPDWFDESVDIFDLSVLSDDLTAVERELLLLDVVRGLTPQRLINVNSRAGWDLLKTYGNQLSHWTELGAYLFTWDLDEEGTKGGYPIREFQQCFDALDWVILDNTRLKDELVERYVMPTELEQKLFVAHTAVVPSELDVSANFGQRRAQDSRIRGMWAGRFDRQKRFDLVVEIATQMPQLEIWAWGKEVLGGLDIDFDDLPPNIKLQGVYDDFDDLPLGSCDFFLYTSEWDGLPTVLLDAGARGMPVVASHVGGVGDILDSETGYPVTDPLFPAAYVKAIQAMLDDPTEVSRRASALRQRVTDVCAEETYARSLAQVLATTRSAQS